VIAVATDEGAGVDPYGVIPDEFPEMWDADGVEEALEKAERAPTTTPREERKRCPECGATRVRLKTAAVKQSHQIDTTRKCNSCLAHFDNPLPPRAEFEAAEPVCPGCHSERLRHANKGGNVRCLACGGRFEAAGRGEFLLNPIMSQSVKSDVSTYRFPRPEDLRKARDALNLDPRDLGGCGTTGSTVVGWELGETSPTMWRVRALLAYYQVVDGHRRAERLADALGLEEVESE